MAKTIPRIVNVAQVDWDRAVKIAEAQTPPTSRATLLTYGVKTFLDMQEITLKDKLAEIAEEEKGD